MDLQEILRETTISEYILLGLFISSCFVQIYYYLGVYLKLGRYKRPEKPDGQEGVSVVICARNEAENLEKFLPRVLSQDYPEYEVVVVNDRSSDNSEDILLALSLKYPRLRYTSLPENKIANRGKKLALTVGLKAAEHRCVLLTDADCYPAGDQWLKSMVSNLGGEKELVLGYGAYERRKSMLNILIRYETLFTAMQYLSFAIRGKPYMGVGRNLAYRKELFFKGGGFSRHYHIPSGDDDLFVNQHAQRDNTAVEFRQEAHTFSLPVESFAAWFRQKRRHLGAGGLYNPSSRIRLGAEYGSRIMCYALFILLMFIPAWYLPVMALFILFQGIRIIVLKLAMLRLNEKYLLLPSFLLDPLMPLLLGIIWIRALSKTKYQPWN